MREGRREVEGEDIEDESGRVLKAQSTKMWKATTKQSSQRRYRVFRHLEVDFLPDVRKGGGIPPAWSYNAQ